MIALLYERSGKFIKAHPLDESLHNAEIIKVDFSPAINYFRLKKTATKIDFSKKARTFKFIGKGPFNYQRFYEEIQ